MSCWVAPTIAAELWGIPLQQILDQIELGSIPSRNEGGFNFVDVAPNSPKFEPSREPRETPPTYTVVTPQEIAALTEEPDESSIELGNWRAARENAQVMRRPPIAA